MELLLLLFLVSRGLTWFLQVENMCNFLGNLKFWKCQPHNGYQWYGDRFYMYVSCMFHMYVPYYYMYVPYIILHVCYSIPMTPKVVYLFLWERKIIFSFIRSLNCKGLTCLLTNTTLFFYNNHCACNQNV